MKKATNNPQITVLMASYNADKYIEKAIESILKQVYKNFEFIIIDDCSTDKTWDIVESYSKKDKRIKIYRNNKNIKSCKTLIKGMKIARGKYIAIMDNDDWSYPDRLRKQYDFLEFHPNVGIVGGTLEIMDENEKIYSERRYELIDKKIREKIFRYSPYAHPLVMLRRSVLEKVGYYDYSFAPADDYELYFRIGIVSEFANLPDKLVKYRVVSTSITRQSTKKMELQTIRVRNKYKDSSSYSMSLFDKLYALIQYISIFVIPTGIKLQLFHRLRDNQIYEKN